MDINKVAVLGTGTMGHHIALACAQGGADVKFRGRTRESVAAGMEKIRKFVNGGVSRGKVTREQSEATLSRIKPVTDLHDAVKDADLVIETVVENINTKKDCFREIDPVCQSHTIFASNTSYQCIIEMARVTR
ncbi:MAG: 3-hydroxyacyl-CoA dehydrogenase family protein, partial [Chloroflexota bacterium]